ncbi:MAG: hypothetical protein JSV14_06770 [Deltaproteobacteria bacterium]|nr:MAG: hypothetical protein JSV14_06770 [Deltaproteobacteria bacterium]
MTVLPGVFGCSFGYAQDKLTLRRTVPYLALGNQGEGGSPDGFELKQDREM